MESLLVRIEKVKSLLNSDSQIVRNRNNTRSTSQDPTPRSSKRSFCGGTPKNQQEKLPSARNANAEKTSIPSQGSKQDLYRYQHSKTWSKSDRVDSVDEIESTLPISSEDDSANAHDEMLLEEEGTGSISKKDERYHFFYKDDVETLKDILKDMKLTVKHLLCSNPKNTKIMQHELAIVQEYTDYLENLTRKLDKLKDEKPRPKKRPACESLLTCGGEYRDDMMAFIRTIKMRYEHALLLNASDIPWPTIQTVDFIPESLARIHHCKSLGRISRPGQDPQDHKDCVYL